MDDQVRLTSIGSQLSGISASTNDLLAQMGVLHHELAGLRSASKKLRGSLAFAHWLIGIIVLLLLTMAASAMYFGKAFATELVRYVVQAENRGQTSLVQYGYFSNNTKISDNPLTFDLKLAQPINPNHVVGVSAEPSAFIPGVSVETRLRDGKVCRIVFNGNTTSFQKLLDDGVQGKLVFTLKN